MNKEQDRRIFIYRIDANDHIISINDAWCSFALENEAFDLMTDRVLNRSLWDFMTDLDTRHLYKLMLSKVRTTHASIKVPFRCDSPIYRRFMELEIAPLPKDAVRFKSRILKLEMRKYNRLLDIGTDKSNELIKMCGWCKKVYVEPAWLEIEEAIVQLDLFGNSKFPQTTHGICPSCKENITRSLM